MRCAPPKTSNQMGAPRVRFEMNSAGSTLHIVYGIDANYVAPMVASIESIISCNPGIYMVFHVLACDISEAEKKRIVDHVENRNGTVHLHDVDMTRIAALQNPLWLTRATYSRFFACEMLRGVTNRVLYLDADIVCLGDISELAILDMQGAVVAAAPDVDQDVRNRDAGLPLTNDYFNAGVLLIDRDRWESEDVTARSLEMLARGLDEYPLADQDVLNILMVGRTKALSKEWNLISGSFRPDESTKFLHFAGEKPWQSWAGVFGDRSFYDHLDRTPWADWKFVPRSKINLWHHARHLFRNGYWASGIYYYVLHWFTATDYR